MPQFKLTYHWEAIIKANDDEEAELKYLQNMENNNETLYNIASESLTVEEIKS